MDLPRDFLTKSDRERQKMHYVVFMWNLKYDTNELIYKVETNSQMQKKFIISKGEMWGRDKLEVWDQQIQTTIYKIDK